MINIRTTTMAINICSLKNLVMVVQYKDLVLEEAVNQDNLIFKISK
jgi:hypothetical protein